MAIRVVIEGKGKVAEFPDGTSPEVIDAAIKRDFFTGSETPNNPADYPQGKTSADQDKMRREWVVDQDGSLLGKVNRGLTYVSDSLKKEPLRLAQEAITVPINQAARSLKGLGSLAVMGGNLAQGKTLDESLQAGVVNQSKFNPIQGPLDSSMVGTGFGKLADLGTQAAENATGNTGFAAAGIDAGMSIAGLLGGGKILKETGKVVAGNPKGLAGLLGVARDTAERLPDVAKLNAQIDTAVNKAFRPGVAGNKTLSQSTGYSESARNAAKEIVLNKENLGLTDEFGEAVNTLPKNLQQARQAVDSTKRSIWQKVEEINTSAGKSGSTVTADTAAGELTALTNNPAYQLMAPETITYAKNKLAAISKGKPLTIAEAQDAVTLANQSTKSFRANPTADTMSRAYVDNMVANHLRNALDIALESATGTPAAAPLRKAYGDLKAIEKDVNQRATVDARKNSKGLIDFADIYTAGELVQAMATMNPVGVAKAGTMAVIKAWIKRENMPNTHVERLFKTADKLVNKVDIPLPKPPVRPQPEAPVYRQRVPMNLPVGQPESNLRQRVPMRALADLQPAEMFFDPTVGRMIPRKMR